jgi:hypothetical protein
MGVLPQECDLPVVAAQRRNLAIIDPVDELFSWTGLFLALEEWQQVVAVEMNLVGHGARQALNPACLAPRDTGVRNTPLSPLSDPFNGALKRPTQKANS